MIRVSFLYALVQQHNREQYCLISRQYLSRYVQYNLLCNPYKRRKSIHIDPLNKLSNSNLFDNIYYYFTFLMQVAKSKKYKFIYHELLLLFGPNQDFS